ncbi:MAG: energy transducer TonB [Bacteroidetes bacterium QS_8_68_28]|jgi:protein TonB|nr:MAG: energy transducer TonB [Bacteroidetes bacterium QS_8_68_28]
MALEKKDGANLRKRYPLFVEGGMILALLILIAAFRFQWGTGEKKTFAMNEQETVDIKEVKQTQQKKKPPPPPRPPVPIEKPDDEVLENEDLDFDATLDLNESLTKTADKKAPPEPDEGEEEKEEVVPFAVIEQKPKMVGGTEALYEEVEYPQFAKRADITGTVYLQFTVQKDGSLTDMKVLRSPHESLSKEAIRAIKAMEFEPGRQRKEPVKTRMSQRVTFELN